MTVQNDLTLVGYQSTTATLKRVKHIYITQENCGATELQHKEWKKMRETPASKTEQSHNHSLSQFYTKHLNYSYTLLDAKKIPI